MHIRNYIFLILVSFFSLSSFSQIYEPVKWSTSCEKLSADEFTLVFTAKIDKNWSIYSQFLDNDDGPVATSFNFDSGNHFSTTGKTEESGNKKEGYDKYFDMKLAKFMDRATFIQKVKVSDANTPIKGYLNFMTCDDTKCLPPTDVEFSFDLSTCITLMTGSDESDPVQSTDQKKEIKEVKPTLSESTTKVETEKVNAPIATENKIEIKEDQISTDAEVVNDPEPILENQIIQAPGADNGILAPVTWEGSIESMGGNKYHLKLHGNIDEGWNIYGQENDPDEGPIPTTLLLDEGQDIVWDGKVKESSPYLVKEFDPYFDLELIKLKKKADYELDFTTDNPEKAITGIIDFMVCDDSRCLPPDPFPFTIYPEKGFVSMGVGAGEVSEGGNGSSELFSINLADVQEPVGTCVEKQEKKSSLWKLFLLGFIGGLVALLTPCVFPMIPLTVSFFTKSSTDKKKGMSNALTYGLSIFFIYVLLSLPFHLLDTIDPNILNNISTNVVLNIIFFLVFLFFAFSFFGYFEITLPSSVTNKVSSAEGIGGFIGIFFMALTLVLVSFSCTGPILGSLLAGALTSEGGAMQLTSGMAGFGLSLSLPFALFAAFPGWMNALPKSGGWLNTVKVVLGFLELALAFKFLSNADLVKQWGLLKIEPFLAIWIIIALAMAAYLFGFLRFPHDSKGAKIGGVRKGLGVLSLVMAIYLMFGFKYDKDLHSFTPLGLLSGLAPPVSYSWIHPHDCPQNINCFHDLEEGMAYAKEVDKPIMLDFTGRACVNCRKMEEHVWSKKRVKKILSDEYVLISLYVDEKIDLPADQQITVDRKTGGTKTLRTTGNKWAFFQTEFFNNNSQPWYVLMTHDGKLLNNPVGYTPDIDEYMAFLKCGLETNESLKGK